MVHVGPTQGEAQSGSLHERFLQTGEILGLQFCKDLAQMPEQAYDDGSRNSDCTAFVRIRHCPVWCSCFRLLLASCCCRDSLQLCYQGATGSLTVLMLGTHGCQSFQARWFLKGVDSGAARWISICDLRRQGLRPSGSFAAPLPKGGQRGGLQLLPLLEVRRRR